MAERPAERIAAGLREALAYARGEDTGATVHRVTVLHDLLTPPAGSVWRPERGASRRVRMVQRDRDGRRSVVVWTAVAPGGVLGPAHRCSGLTWAFWVLRHSATCEAKACPRRAG